MTTRRYCSEEFNLFALPLLRERRGADWCASERLCGSPRLAL